MTRKCVLFLLCAGLAGAQVITTVAGTETIFPDGGVQALNAALRGANGVTVDSSGNVYIADAADHLVLRISSTGLLTVVAGNGSAGFSGDGGPATKASLTSPVAVTFDSSGNLYIADSDDNRIRKVSGGIITTFAGTGVAGFSGDNGPASGAALNEPSSLAFDRAGSLYVADSLNHRVRKITGGIITTVAGNGNALYSGDNGPATGFSLNYPAGVTVDSSGTLYIADEGNNRVRKVTAGTITTFAGNGTPSFAGTGDGGLATLASLNAPIAVAVDSAGIVYIACYLEHTVRKVSQNIITSVVGDGTPAYSGDGGAANKATITQPLDIALDSSGNLYIADYGNHRIRKVSGGTISTIAGSSVAFGDGGPAAAATLNNPQGIALDSAGNLLIADTYNVRIRKVAAGAITTVAGSGATVSSGDGGTPANAGLYYPTAVAVDASGSIYIAEYTSCRIRKITAGTITTIAGTGECAFSADPSSTVTTPLWNPTGVAVDSAGAVYFTEPRSHRVRKIQNQQITTVAGNGTAGYSGDGGAANRAMLSSPRGLAVDAAGVVYIADSGNNVIRKVVNGNITTVAGNGTGKYTGDGVQATTTSLNSPQAVLVDSSGNLFIADTDNNRVRRVSTSGIITTVAGDGNSAFRGDGGPATSASMDAPLGLALDSGGSLYIVDFGNDRIRKVVATSTITYQAAPSTLTFSATAGGSTPGSQAIVLSTPVAGLSYTASADAPWLTVTQASGTIPATLQVTANPTSLTGGTYQGTVTITAANAVPPTTTVRVTFAVQAPVPPTLTVDNQGVSFTALQGGSDVSQTLRVQNTGGGSLSFTAAATTTSGGSWLGISAASGTATPSDPVLLTVVATPGTLGIGTYNGVITVTGAGKTIAVPVTLSVASPASTILLSQAALNYEALAQGGVPLTQNFGILNTGNGSMSWTASASTISGGNWLKISPTSGTVTRPFLDVSLVNVAIDPATLAPGTYYGRIQVSAPAANTPQVMTVILNVREPGFTLGSQVFPAGLIFTGVAGQTPGSQDVQVGNRAAQATNFISGIIGTGFAYLPTNATVVPTQPTTVRVYPDFTKLAGGSVQRGTITLQFADGSPQTISVLMVAAPPDGSSALAAALESCHPAEGIACPAAQPLATCTSTGLQVLFRSPQPSQSTVSVTVGQSLTVDVQVSDSCGKLIGPGNESSQVTARFSSGEPVPMTHIGNGIWQGSWRPLTSGSTLMNVVAVSVQGSNRQAGQTSTVTCNVSSVAPRDATPTVTAQGVVHAASAVGGVPIAPGGLISVYGQDLADSAGQSNALPLPQQLNGTQVMLGNQPLPILYSSSTQLNVQVPYAVPINQQYALTVQRGNALSVPQSLVVAAAEPGIFTANQSGSGQGSIVKSDGVTLAQPGTPATIGETVVIYCTGLGSVTPKVAEGQAAPLTPPFSITDNSVTVTIGGKTAAVAFSGLTPGSAGLYQVNAVVPDGIATGDAVPVIISVAGQTSPPVTMAVR